MSEKLTDTQIDKSLEEHEDDWDCLTIGELKEQIKDIDDDIEIFIRCKANPCGNIIEAKKAKKSTYGFFGKEIPCVIIEPNQE